MTSEGEDLNGLTSRLMVMLLLEGETLHQRHPPGVAKCILVRAALAADASLHRTFLAHGGQPAESMDEALLEELTAILKTRMVVREVQADGSLSAPADMH